MVRGPLLQQTDWRALYRASGIRLSQSHKWFTLRIVHPDADPATAADAAIQDIAELLPVLRGWGVQV